MFGVTLYVIEFTWMPATNGPFTIGNTKAFYQTMNVMAPS